MATVPMTVNKASKSQSSLSLAMLASVNRWFAKPIPPENPKMMPMAAVVFSGEWKMLSNI
jgi:hypothetical protein